MGWRSATDAPTRRGALALALAALVACDRSHVRSADTGPSSIPTYAADGRLPLAALYRAYTTLVTDHGWSVHTIYRQTDRADGARLELPILAFTSPREGESLWILGGIHGEEPAGPNAIAGEIDAIAALGEAGVSVVLLPLCNPKAYRNNWRYPNTPERDWRKGGYSVGDSEYLLPDLEDATRPRADRPSGPDAAALTAWVLRTATRRRPAIVIDHHEDEKLDGGYIYSQGAVAVDNPVAREVVALLAASGIPLQRSGTTRFGEPIVAGVISADDKGGRIRDGSIDELLGSATVLVAGSAKPGPAASTVIVVETPVVDVPLADRVRAHAGVVRALEELWRVGAPLRE